LHCACAQPSSLKEAEKKRLLRKKTKNKEIFPSFFVKYDPQSGVHKCRFSCSTIAYALEREPEMFIKTQLFLAYFKELKESQYTFDIQKNKTKTRKWEQ